MAVGPVGAAEQLVPMVVAAAPACENEPADNGTSHAAQTQSEESKKTIAKST